MKFGYARVSAAEQNLELQLDALNAYCADEIFTEKISSASTERPELNSILNKLRKDDVLVVWRLDKLGRTTGQLVSLIEEFNQKVCILYLYRKVFIQQRRPDILYLPSSRLPGAVDGTPADLSLTRKMQMLL